MNQKAKKFWNPSVLGEKKMRKGERLQRVELQSICAVMSKFMDAEIQIQKVCRKFQPNQ